MCNVKYRHRSVQKRSLLTREDQKNTFNSLITNLPLKIYPQEMNNPNLGKTFFPFIGNFTVLKHD